MRDTCVYCGHKLVQVFDQPHKDRHWGGSLRCCPVCESDFIGRISPTPELTRPTLLDVGRPKPRPM